MPKETTSKKNYRQASHAGPSNYKSSKPSRSSKNGQGPSGVSKLKSSIRQTERLLAKDNLEPSLRIRTERRLHSLKQDLASATEKQLAVSTDGGGEGSKAQSVKQRNKDKHNRVRFFESQKLLRLIKRYSSSSSSSSKSTTNIDKRDKAGIFLYYVYLFPYNEKYIALFLHSSNTTTNEETSSLRLPPYLDRIKSGKISPKPKIDSDDHTALRRIDILQRVTDLISEGKLPLNPEDSSHEDIVKDYSHLVPNKKSTTPSKQPVAEGVNSEQNSTKGKFDPSPQPGSGAVEDDFFESD